VPRSVDDLQGLLTKGGTQELRNMPLFEETKTTYDHSFKDAVKNNSHPVLGSHVCGYFLNYNCINVLSRDLN